MREEDKAYLAGVIDGDGCMYISKVARKDKPQGCMYVPGISVVKSSEDLIKKVSSLINGSVCVKGKQYRWYCNSKNRCASAIPIVFTHLRSKKEQAKIVLKFCLGEMGGEDAYNVCQYLNKVHDETKIDTTCRTRTETPERWAYIAGLMDTDGCFMISKRDLSRRGCINPTYVAKISFGETDSRTTSAIWESFPKGSITYKQGRQVWELVISSEIIEFIEKILPYMTAKKKNAEVLLGYCQNYAPMRKGAHLGISRETLDFREKCYQNLLVLQRRKGKKVVVNKPSLIDSESLEQANEAQARNVQGDRLSERDAMSVCNSQDTDYSSGRNP